MNGLPETIGDIRDEVSAYEILAGCGIPLLLISEDMFNNSDFLPSEVINRISDELYTLSSVLATCATQHERILKTLMVRLNGDIKAVAVKNPLYKDGNEKDHPF